MTAPHNLARHKGGFGLVQERAAIALAMRGRGMTWPSDFVRHGAVRRGLSLSRTFRERIFIAFVSPRGGE